jgi:hypothetical protein
MNETVQKHREYFKSGVTLDLDWRIHQLKILKKTIKKYEENLVFISWIKIRVNPRDTWRKN